MHLERRVTVAAIVALALIATAAYADPTLLVISQKDNTLQLFNATTLDSLAVIGTGEGPHELVMSPDGRFAYVGNYHGSDNTVSVIDIAKREIVGTIPINPYSIPHGLDITSDGKTLYCTAEQRRAIVEIDLTQRKVTRAFKSSMHQTHFCLLTKDETTLIGVNVRDGNVTLFDLASGEIDKFIIAGKGVEGIDISLDGRYVWTANSVENTLAIIDMQEKRRVKVLEQPGYPLRLKFSPDGKEVWVTCATFGKLVVYDAATHESIGEMRVGNQPMGLEMAPAGDYVYLTVRDDNHVLKIDRAERKVLLKATTGNRPDGVAWIK